MPINLYQGDQAAKMTRNNPDVSDTPLYTIAQAARYVGLPSTTLRDWVRGRKYSTSDGEVSVARLITPVQEESPSLSFNNLVEAHVLRFMRNKQELPMYQIRDAIDYAQKELDVDRLLLRKNILVDNQNIFLDRLSELIDLNKSGQLAMKTILIDHLNRIEYQNNLPKGLYPFLPSHTSDKVVLINPNISFGNPVTAKRHISTEILAERFDAGEEIVDLAKDYDIDKKAIEQAISYARAA